MAYRFFSRIQHMFFRFCLFFGLFPFPFCTLFPNLVVCIVGFFYSSWLVGMKTTTKVNENHQFCYFFAQIFVALRFLENDERAP